MSQASEAEINQKNRLTFDEPKTVLHYSTLDFLFRSERVLFSRFLEPSMRVLDIGVGGGRTTANLLSHESYIGIDRSPAMIEACRRRFPERRFEVIDVTQGLPYAKTSFEAIVFSFNGLGYLYPDRTRRLFFDEACRVLGDEGVLIFSLHHPDEWIRLPTLKDASVTRIVWRIARSFVLSVASIVCYPFRAATWLGKGWTYDSAHGGLYTFRSRPELIYKELHQSGFDLIEWTTAPEPGMSRFAQPWIYYVARKKRS